MARRPIRSSARSSSAACRAAASRVHQLLSDGRRPGARRTVQPRPRVATRSGLRLLGSPGGLGSRPIIEPRLAGGSGTGCAIQVVDQTRITPAEGRNLFLFEDFAMILTSNTPLTDQIAEWLGRRLARYLARPVKDLCHWRPPIQRPSYALYGLATSFLSRATPASQRRSNISRNRPGPIRRSVSGRFQVGANHRVSRMFWSRPTSSMA